eukprot:COSAG02_NODE_536_length_20657_cov_91.744041_13_plen_179_part_00
MRRIGEELSTSSCSLAPLDALLAAPAVVLDSGEGVIGCADVHNSGAFIQSSRRRGCGREVLDRQRGGWQPAVRGCALVSSRGSSLVGSERAGPATQVRAGMALMDYATCSSCKLSMEWRYTSHDESEVEVERQNLQDAALVLRGPKTNRACIHPQPTHVRRQQMPPLSAGRNCTLLRC